MGTNYLLDLADWCRAAGLAVHEDEGWEYRARGSGGFDGDRPWCIMWHHTASDTTPQNDVEYICRGHDDSPIANLYLARDASVWVCAGGATNTNGKGGPYSVSRGVVPVDQMNTYAVSIEAANDGVGQAWPQVQIDAYFTLNNTLTARLGLQPSDLCEHAIWAPGRKIDPARADAVQGPWRPGSLNTNGTWNQNDVAAEAVRRIGIPPPDPGIEEPVYIWRHKSYADQFAIGAGALHINQTVLKKLRAQGVPEIAENDNAMLDYVCWASGFPKANLTPV